MLVCCLPVSVAPYPIRKSSTDGIAEVIWWAVSIGIEAPPLVRSGFYWINFMFFRDIAIEKISYASKNQF